MGYQNVRREPWFGGQKIRYKEGELPVLSSGVASLEGKWEFVSIEVQRGSGTPELRFACFRKFNAGNRIYVVPDLYALNTVFNKPSPGTELPPSCDFYFLGEELLAKVPDEYSWVSCQSAPGEFVLGFERHLGDGLPRFLAIHTKHFDSDNPGVRAEWMQDAFGYMSQTAKSVTLAPEDFRRLCSISIDARNRQASAHHAVVSY